MGKSGVVAFAFGVPATIVPNRQIATLAETLAREQEAPIFTQCDVEIGLGFAVSKIENQGGNPPSTLAIAREAVRWARQHGLTTLWVVAAKPHVTRAVRDLTAAVREAGYPIEVRTCPAINQYPPNSWFSKESVQKRVQSPRDWGPRERILLSLPFSVYKRVAK